MCPWKRCHKIRNVFLLTFLFSLPEKEEKQGNNYELSPVSVTYVSYSTTRAACLTITLAAALPISQPAVSRNSGGPAVLG